MYRITEDRVTRWSKISRGGTNWEFPVAISVACPYCNIKHGFALAPPDTSAVTRIQQGTPLLAECLGCQGSIRCYVFHADEGSDRVREIWVHPPPQARDPLPIEGNCDLPERLVRDYHAALDCYASGHWRAATSLARIILEGFVKHLLPAAEFNDANGRPRMLAELTRVLSKHRDLAQPNQ